MAAYVSGDVRAFDTLVNRYRARTFGFLKRLLRDESYAEDALMETFLKVHRGAAQYTPQGLFKTWLFQIAYREGLKIIKVRNKSAKDISFDATDVSAGLADPSPSPELSVMERQRLKRVDKVLESLPKNHRAVFLLFYGEGMSTPQIATALNIGPSSVRSYLTLARQALRQELRLVL